MKNIHVRAALLGVALLALEGHVTIEPGEVVAGAATRFTVRVPTERPEATVKLRVELPAGLGAPRFLSKPGWSLELEKDAAGNVTAVTWSGGTIAPDAFDEFVFTARTPDVAGMLLFRAYQTYAGGEVVAWENPEGDEGPAPRVLVRAEAEADAVTDAGIEAGVAPAAQAATASAPASPAGAPMWMGAAALGLSVLALALALARRT